MLTAHQLSKSYEIDPLFKNVSFSLNPGERIGLVGANGCGKTTLLRILAGEERPDGGHVATPAGTRIGYLPQGFAPDPALTLDEVVGQAAGDPATLEAELARLAIALADHPGRDDLQTAYDATLHRLGRIDPGRGPAILAALGLDDVPGNRPVGHLSGGQKTRLALALVLLNEPDLLLLDEPTNHLDIAMLEWLEEWLAHFPGGTLIVSHDRTFLDRTVTGILAFDPYGPAVRAYPGNYSAYRRQVRREREAQWTAYKDQQYEIRQMKQDIARTKAQARSVERSTKLDTTRRYAKKVAKKAKARETKLERYLASDERVEKPERRWKMKLDFGEPAHLGRQVLTLADLAVGYDTPLLRALTLHVQAGQRIVLTGPNGSGKTTLLRTIAGKLAPLSGRVRIGASVKMGVMTQEQVQLDPDRSALEMVQRVAALDETDARSFLHFFLFSDDDPLRPSRELSFGERARLALALLVADGCNFLLLDEPINHLDIPSRDRFEEALSQFEGTILAVVHDRTFIDRFATDVWRVEDGSIRHEIRT